MPPHRLIEASNGRVVCERLRIADRFWSRLIGLQFRRTLPTGEGLLLVPCASVHTLFVRFAIDIVMLDERFEVIEVRTHVRPWRFIVPQRRTHAMLELPAGTANVVVGERLKVE